MKSKSRDRKSENVELFTKHLYNFKSKDTSPQAIIKKTEDFEKLAELFIWSEKNEMVLNDPFMENNVLGLFFNLLTACSKSTSTKNLFISLIRSYSFLISNLKRQEMLNYVYSHPVFNNFIKFPFDFKDDEILFYYINFIKSLSQKVDGLPVQIFYNQVI